MRVSDDEVFRRDHVSVDRENSPPAEPPAIVSDERIASDHGSILAGPPAVVLDERIASNADSEPDDLPVLQELQREVGSNLHQATQFPKNRMCDICCRARMYKRRFSRRKANENKGAIPDPKAFGERPSTNFIVVNRSSSTSRASPSTPSAASGAIVANPTSMLSEMTTPARYDASQPTPKVPMGCIRISRHLLLPKSCRPTHSPGKATRPRSSSAPSSP